MLQAVVERLGAGPRCPVRPPTCTTLRHDRHRVAVVARVSKSSPQRGQSITVMEPASLHRSRSRWSRAPLAYQRRVRVPGVQLRASCAGRSFSQARASTICCRRRSWRRRSQVATSRSATGWRRATRQAIARARTARSPSRATSVTMPTSSWTAADRRPGITRTSTVAMPNTTRRRSIRDRGCPPRVSPGRLLTITARPYGEAVSRRYRRSGAPGAADRRSGSTAHDGRPPSRDGPGGRRRPVRRHTGAHGPRSWEIRGLGLGQPRSPASGVARYPW